MRKLARRSPGSQLVRRSGSPVPLGQHGEADIVNRRPEAIAQRQLAEFIQTSPRAVAQAKREAALRQETAQRVDSAPTRHLPHAEDQAGMEDDESAQLKRSSTPLQRLATDDEALQKRAAAFPVQRVGAEDEEPLQAMATEEELPAQRLATEDEALQKRAAAFPVQRVGPEEEEPLQAMASEEEAPAQLQTDQQPARNQTGMPDGLKAGIESLSGLDMSDVRVHANSDRPAQLNALAYAQGSEIHLAPGQERHLPHEAWHVVQQRQGRVKPTLQAKGVAINDDKGLEQEADVMGARATQMKGTTGQTRANCAKPRAVVQRCKSTKEVLATAKTFDDRKAALVKYVAELGDSMGEFYGKLTEHIELAVFDQHLFKGLEQAEAWGGKVTEAESDWGNYVEFIDNLTEEYKSVKEGSHPALKKGAEEKDKKSDHAEKKDAKDEGEAYQTEVKNNAAYKPKGNDRFIARATVDQIARSVQVIKGLKQDLLNQEKSGQALIRLTEEYGAVKALVTQKARQSTVKECQEYWTMLRGGLVDALQRADKSFEEGLVCNDELATWLGAFLAEKFQFI